MAKHTAPRAMLTAFGEAVLTFPYSAQMVDELKAAVPFRYRTWDPTRKVWTVGAPFVDLAIEILLTHFPDAEVPRRGRTRTTTTPPAGDDHFCVLHLLPSAPPELIRAAYRCLAKLHHPDKAGDPAIMRQLTEAHDALTRRLSA